MLILSCSAIRQGPEQVKIEVFVEGKGGSEGGNGLSVHERDIPRYQTKKYHSKESTKMIIHQNYLSSSSIAKHFLPTLATLLDNQPG